MIKPASLRAALSSTVAFLARNPDKLLVFVTNGNIVSTGAPSLGFEYGYNLELIVTDFPESSDNIVIPILAWLQTNQPEMLANPDLRSDGFKFEAEILNNSTCDIKITLALTERVIVAIADGVIQATHLDEPPPVAFDPIDWQSLTIPGVVEDIAGDALLTGGGEFEQLTDGSEYVEYE